MASNIPGYIRADAPIAENPTSAARAATGHGRAGQVPPVRSMEAETAPYLLLPMPEPFSARLGFPCPLVQARLGLRIGQSFRKSHRRVQTPSAAEGDHRRPAARQQRPRGV